MARKNRTLDTELQLLAKKEGVTSDEYIQLRWGVLRDQYIDILGKDEFKALINYSNEQSSYKSQSRYGILYPFLRLFNFSSEFAISDVEKVLPVEFGVRKNYELDFHTLRIVSFGTSLNPSAEEIKKLLYYNAYRSYTSMLNLKSWVENNEGARRFFNTDKLAALGKISKLTEPFEELGDELFAFARAVYNHISESDAIQIKIPKGYSLLRRNIASYTVSTIRGMLEENCKTPITKESVIVQVNKYIASYSALINGLILTATTTFNTANKYINEVDDCLRLIGSQSATSEGQGVNLEPKITALNTEWHLPASALTVENLLSNFSQWRSRAVYNRTNILASIRLSMETYNKIIKEVETNKKLEVASISYYTSLVTKTIATLSDNLNTFHPVAGAILATPLSTLSSLGEQIATGSGNLDLQRIEIATSYDQISKEEVKVIDELWTSVLIDIERFIKEGMDYVKIPKKVEPEVQ